MLVTSIICMPLLNQWIYLAPQAVWRALSGSVKARHHGGSFEVGTSVISVIFPVIKVCAVFSSWVFPTQLPHSWAELVVCRFFLKCVLLVSLIHTMSTISPSFYNVGNWGYGTRSWHRCEEQSLHRAVPGPHYSPVIDGDFPSGLCFAEPAGLYSYSPRHSHSSPHTTHLSLTSHASSNVEFSFLCAKRAQDHHSNKGCSDNYKWWE